MDIHFQTSRLGREFSQEKSLVRKYGAECAKLIMRRLAQLHAAATLGDLRALPQVRCHELHGSRFRQLSLDVKHPYRLIIRPAHDPIPVKADGGLDWTMVTAISILGVEDTHG